MPIERLQRKFDIDNSGELVIVFGSKGRKFILPTLRFVFDDELFYHFLREHGYEQILFFSSGEDGLYALDKKSFEFLNLVPKEESKNSEQLPRGFVEDDSFSTDESSIQADSPSPRIDFQTDENGRFRSNQRDLTALELLSLMAKDKSRKKAFIFTDTDLLFTSPQESQAGYSSNLQRFISSWSRRQNNDLKLFFLFQSSDESAVIQQIERDGLTTLKSVISGDTVSTRNKIHLLNPGLDEITNLVDYHRIINQKKIDWKNRDAILEELVYQDKSLNEWDTLLNRITSISAKDFANCGTKLSLNRKSGWESLSELIGLKKVKSRITSFVNLMKGIIKDGVEGFEPRLHLMLTGNTGTGKTVVAEIVAQIYREEKLLNGGKFTEVKASQLIEEHVGGTAKRTRELCEKALGGVLFIDEAYAIAQSQFGGECMAELIQYMENEREQLAVIFAGYRKDMDKLFDLNEGLKNRIGESSIIHFDDYSPNELFRILQLKIKPLPFILDSEEVRQLLIKFFGRKIRDDSKGFGNGRGVEQLVQKLLEYYYTELHNRNVTEFPVADLSELLDIPLDDNENDSDVDISAWDTLKNKFIGLQSVKEEIEDIVSLVTLQQNRRGKIPSLHMIFAGNPGTGKTEVAKLVGQIYKEEGVLKSGHLVQASRKDIIGRHLGDSENNMADKCKEALDGVLFLDEAYSFVGDQYGQKAIDTLLEFMERYRNRFVVIAAGYPNEIDEFLNMNPGLKSRFASHIPFQDFTAGELTDIFLRLVKEEKLQLSATALPKIQAVFKHMIANKDKHFANAREVRKLFENTLKRYARRFRSGNSQEKILPDDIPYELPQQPDEEVNNTLINKITLVESDNNKEIEEEIEIVDASQKTDQTTLLQKCFQSDKWYEQLDNLKDFVNTYPQNEEAFFRIGELSWSKKFSQGLFDQAIEAFETVIKLNSENTMANYYLSHAAYLRGDLDKAKSFIQKFGQHPSQDNQEIAQKITLFYNFISKKDKFPQHEGRIIYQAGQRKVNFLNLYGNVFMGIYEIDLKDPYIRVEYQLEYLIEFCLAIFFSKGHTDIVTLRLQTTNNSERISQSMRALNYLKELLKKLQINLIVNVGDENHSHRREITTDTGWEVTLDRGIAIYNEPSNLLNRINQGYRSCRDFYIIYNKTIER